eukprot:NODE_5337_length_689_cov_21.271875_g4963_i0.p1 GENE.NODE_5337_length_689_cov_21.271875_g4963_i0~~NODE_5337_length_689_cov_21.271875_g4963_i0.p1  ORF type:complete len:163 (-),score=37.48 NODE_5337_length_689_cov_21.271875_g4963_i0:62-550(-)
MSTTTSSNAEWLQAWYIFDSQKEDRLPKSDFFHLVRALGKKFSQADLESATQDLPDPLSKDQFLKFMAEVPYEAPERAALVEALELLGGRCGSIRQTDLAAYLTALGEPIPSEDVQAVLQNVKFDDERRIKVEDLASFLFKPQPSVIPHIIKLQEQLSAFKA